MAARKPKPTHIYREETFCPSNRALAHTRQTFDVRQYEQWRRNAERNTPHPIWAPSDYEVCFYVGEILWRPA